jgi:hypothetical protein
MEPGDGRTGERTYCIIAEWVDMDALVNARSNLIAPWTHSATHLRTWVAGSASPMRFQGLWSWR